jgi:hypothetical protein
MLAVLIGIKTPAEMLGALAELVILGAAALRRRFGGFTNPATPLATLKDNATK